MSRKITLLLIPFCALLLSPLARAGQSDDALMKACPGVAAWAVDHPRHGEDSAPSSETRRQVEAPKLRDELARRAASDQSARNAWIAASTEHKLATGKLAAAVDSDNLSWLKAVVKRQGFPTAEQVGGSGVDDAWMLVQHADSDPIFQAQVLDMLKPRLASGGVRKKDFALLVDRVRRAQGKPQIYGSQFTPDKLGRLMPEPIEDMPHVDQRRAAMNLMPLAAYGCMLRFTYAPAAAAAH